MMMMMMMMMIIIIVIAVLPFDTVISTIFYLPDLIIIIYFICNLSMLYQSAQVVTCINEPVMLNYAAGIPKATLRQYRDSITYAVVGKMMMVVMMMMVVVVVMMMVMIVMLMICL